MAQLTTAGKLLLDIHENNPALRDAVAVAASIPEDRADAAMRAESRLTLTEQLRLAEAVIVHAPAFARQARRLRGQALAARSYEQNEVQVHSDVPAMRWERSAQMRR